MINYLGFKLVDIPSGMGGTLPAALTGHDLENSEDVQVICLHPEYYTNWLLSIPKNEIKPLSYQLTDKMKQLIKRRIK